jgi:protein phosphatase
MGTTLSALAILPQGAMVAQVGDSRIYRLRGHCLEQLSFDHSLVWELRAAGRFPLSEIPNFIPKNIITRSLGPNSEIQVDLEGPYAIEPGDTFLLCSDGLSGQVKDEEIGKVLACLGPEEAVRALVDLANLNGGPDNITAIVVRITGPQVAQSKARGSRAGRVEPQPVSPVVWSLVGLFGLGFLGLLAIDLWIAALASLVGAIITGIVGWRLRYRIDEPAAGSGVELGRRGRGPYARTQCVPDAPFVARLAEIVQQLRDAATKEAWTIHWEEFHAQGRKADAAAASRDHAEAVRAYCRALTFMMAELRNQRARKPPDNGTTAAS